MWRQNHKERERVRQYCRREKKNATPCCFVSLSARELSLRLVSVEIEMRKNGKWDLGFWGRNECE
jgi:hypothetical protein